MSTSREAFEAWAMGKYGGSRLKPDISDVEAYYYIPTQAAWEAWQSAMQHAYADAAYLCDQMFNRAADADECADAIRERAKEILK